MKRSPNVRLRNVEPHVKCEEKTRETNAKCERNATPDPQVVIVEVLLLLVVLLEVALVVVVILMVVVVVVVVVVELVVMIL